jgi:alginate O-acetyltransferase complex protein AlgI
MLFNAYSFIAVFLPVSLFGYFLSGWLGGDKYGGRAAILWLLAASLVFYGLWNVRLIGLLLLSIGFNYAFGLILIRKPGRILLGFAISCNLLLLGWFKYANFFISTLNDISNAQLPLFTIILPLGISFFTFTQIAFLVDTWRGKVREVDPFRYALFVTYFPHLVAGPLLHHQQIMPQFGNPATLRPHAADLQYGFALFILGLAKKVLLADSFAEHSTPVFDAAQDGALLEAFISWKAALAYTLQLYFDFSGYSDMAIGMSRMFGITLPVNFSSPYKARNISEFWRRWHMTLSTFLREYLYIPLGGNRHGAVRTGINLMATMLLGGLWHGANWTFAVWGGLHGLYLLLHRLWQYFRRDAAPATGMTAWIGNGLATGLTLLCVVIGWVFFRAESFEAATIILSGMIGLNGLGSLILDNWGVALFATGGIIVLWLPSSQQCIERISSFDGGYDKRLGMFKPIVQGAGLGLLLLASLHRIYGGNSEFLYFQF